MARAGTQNPDQRIAADYEQALPDDNAADVPPVVRAEGGKKMPELS
jgi:hypothetical protein